MIRYEHQRTLTNYNVLRAYGDVYGELIMKHDSYTPNVTHGGQFYKQGNKLRIARPYCNHVTVPGAINIINWFNYLMSEDAHFLSRHCFIS